MPTDPRIPVTILPDAASLPAWLGTGGPAAVLADGPVPPSGAVAVEPFTARPLHRFGCACCAARSAAAIAFDRLFQARARGRCPWFDRVLVMAASPTGRSEAALALAQDPLTASRYRTAPGPAPAPPDRPA
jgi:hypothetical protein